MDILFGWELDGAAWLRGDKRGTVGQVTAGPGGFASILGTRLGITAPETPRPLRVAAYRRALESAAHPWCAKSLELDGWATASQLLSLRDELVALGWEASSGSECSPRLSALAGAEREFSLDREHVGDADLLRTVVRELHSRANSPDAMRAVPVGIDSITVLDRAHLPSPWTEILTSLEVLGVEVTDAEEPQPVRSVRIISAATEWQAAETAARILATDPSLTLVSTARSDVLDQELSRRGLPRIGQSESSDQRASAEIIPLFLDAVTAPFDIHAFAALLDLGLSSTRDEDGTVHAIRLVPSAVRNALLDALAKEPGVGGSVWGRMHTHFAEAFHETLGTYGADSPEHRRADTEATVAGDLNRLVAGDALDFSGGSCLTGGVASALSWLELRLRKLGRATNAPALTAASASVASVIAALRDLDRVTKPELARIIADCCPPAPSPLGGAEASARATCASPGQLAAAPENHTVLWWGAIDDSTPLSRRWTPAEVRELLTAGITVPDPAALAALSVTAQLRGLRTAGDVVAVVMRSQDGAPTTLHPLLDFAVLDTDLPGDTVPGRIEAATVDASGLTDSVSWAFGDSLLAVTEPVPEQIEPVDPTLRRVRPGTHLLPDRLSYSQTEKLLIHRLEWLLRYPLEIKPGQLSTLPSGNQLIGTFEHAIVEELVQRRIIYREEYLEEMEVPVTADEVADVFDAFLPQLASELLLPGQSRRREQVRREALASVPELFAVMANAGIRLRAVEAEFKVPLTLTLKDPLPDGARPDITHTVTIGGFRDLDAEGNEGLPVVVDLKYSGSKTKYRDLVQNGRSLQLAIYAWSVAEEQALPLSAVTTAYYELKYGRFNSVDPRLGNIAAGDSPDTDELWEAAKRSLSEALAEIAFDGTIRDIGNELLVRENEAGLNYGQAKKAAELVADTARMNGGFLPTESYSYVDYGVLTGIEGDFS